MEYYENYIIILRKLYYSTGKACQINIPFFFLTKKGSIDRYVCAYIIKLTKSVCITVLTQLSSEQLFNTQSIKHILTIFL